MRMEALTEALRECRVACWICVCANSLSHTARPTAPLSQCPVVLQVSALPAALPHTTHKRLCNPRPTPSTHLICFSYSFHRCTLPAPLSYAAVLFLLAWGDICAQRLSSKRSFFVCVFRNAAFHEFISSNEGKQQIDSHDLFTRAWHPLSPTLGGKINISSIQLFFFTVRQICCLVPWQKAQAVNLIGDAYTVSPSSHANHWLTVILPTRTCSWINIIWCWCWNNIYCWSISA